MVLRVCPRGQGRFGLNTPATAVRGRVRYTQHGQGLRFLGQRGRESFSVNGFSTWQAGWPKKTPDPLVLIAVLGRFTSAGQQLYFMLCTMAALLATAQPRWPSELSGEGRVPITVPLQEGMNGFRSADLCCRGATRAARKSRRMVQEHRTDLCGHYALVRVLARRPRG